MRNWRYIAASMLSLAFVLGCTNMAYHSDNGGTSGSARMPSSSGSFRAGLDGWLSAEENATVWNKYCIGNNADPGEIPKPNYSNPFIANYVLPKLRQVGDKSFYLYGDVLEVYGLRDPATKAWCPSAL